MHGITATISECESSRGHERLRVVQEGPKSSRHVSVAGDVRVRTTDTVSVGTGSKVVGNSPVVGNRNATRAPAIDDAKGCASLMDNNSGELPIIKQQFCGRRVQDGSTRRIVRGGLVRGVVIKYVKPVVQETAC